MEIEQIKIKMQPGDLNTAATVVGISPNNASKALTRPNSKHFNALVEVLTKVISMREIMLQELLTPEQ
ncbi:hypothetical protein [uncultured Mucilaginibacter sp.]|uniref:hypothetical protein n=1 Tax=uncultured Mucilaginibacter sp. TaxID=797541 RepID=UPI0025EB1ACE|nr:hypothetical protein [uncultured Mucilaginibacter sp.]